MRYGTPSRRTVRQNSSPRTTQFDGKQSTSCWGNQTLTTTAYNGELYRLRTRLYVEGLFFRVGYSSQTLTTTAFKGELYRLRTRLYAEGRRAGLQRSLQVPIDLHIHVTLPRLGVATTTTYTCTMETLYLLIDLGFPTAYE